MTISVGDKMPEATFNVMTAEGPGQMTSAELFDGRKVIWPIVNAGASDAYIESAELRWPVANSDLTKLKRDGANFHAFSSPVPGTSYGTIQPGDSDGRINDGDVGELFMEFSNDALADHKEYWIEVRFASGCRLVYAPREDLALGTAADRLLIAATPLQALQLLAQVGNIAQQAGVKHLLQLHQLPAFRGSSG